MQEQERQYFLGNKNPVAKRAGKTPDFPPKPAAFCPEFPQGVFPP
jgi:hypothetical protein